MGPLAVGLIAPLLSALKQKLTAYGLMAVGSMIVVFATGYALDAIHSLLMFRYGGVAASLTVAGGLLLLALASIGVALYMKSRPVSATLAFRSSPYTYAPVRAPISKKSGVAIAAAIAGALSAATLIVLSKRVRMALAGTKELEHREAAGERTGRLN